MNTPSLKLITLFCLILTVVLLGVMESARAQDEEGGSADQKLANQKGLGNKKIDKDKLPGKLQYAIVIGSVIAMIGTLKYA